MLNIKRRFAAVLLCMAVLLSGCQKDGASEETSSETSKEQIITTTEEERASSTDGQNTETEEQSETTKDEETSETSAAASSESEESSASEASDPNVLSDPSFDPDPSWTIPLPPDNVAKQLLKEAKDPDSQNSDNVIVLCADGKYKVVPTLSIILEFYEFTLEYNFTEEKLKKEQETKPEYANLTLDEFRKRQVGKYDQSDIDTYLDSDYRLKERPNDRVGVIVSYALGDTFDDDEYLEKCIMAGFAQLNTDPELKASMDDALSDKVINGNTAQSVTVSLEYDAEQNIRVVTMIYTYDKVYIESEITFKNENAKLTNTFKGNAKISVSNVFTQRYASRNFEMEWDEDEAQVLFDRLEKLRKNSSSPKETLDAETNLPGTVQVTFEDEFQSKYSYLRDGIWRYQSFALNSDIYFAVNDQKENMRLLDELRTYASLPEINNSNRMRLQADFATTYDKPVLQDQYPQGNSQRVRYYVNDVAYFEYTCYAKGDAAYYHEFMYSNDVAMNYTFTKDEYEYGGVSGEMYYRTEMPDVFWTADRFEGYGSLDPLLKESEDPYTFEYGFAASDGGKSFHVDVYSNSMYRLALCMDANGVPFAGWKWSDTSALQERDAKKMAWKAGMAIIQTIVTMDQDPKLDQFMEHAGSHTIIQGDEDTQSSTTTTANRKAEDWVRADEKEEGLPDLTGKITNIGDEIDFSPVVQDYLEYFEGGRPYYMELYCFGGSQKNHEILTVKDMDFYHSVSMLSHESDQTIEYQCVALGDTTYLKSGDDLFTEPKAADFSNKDVLEQLPDALSPLKTHTFVKAYPATIGDLEYVIEEWLVEGQPTLFYCYDGDLSGFLTTVNDTSYTWHLNWFEIQAKDSLLKALES